MGGIRINALVKNEAVYIHDSGDQFRSVGWGCESGHAQFLMAPFFVKECRANSLRHIGRVPDAAAADEPDGFRIVRVEEKRGNIKWVHAVGITGLVPGNICRDVRRQLLPGAATIPGLENRVGLRLSPETVADQHVLRVLWIDRPP
jgi:hypothetical protein